MSEGAERIAWTRANMPLLAALRDEYAALTNAWQVTPHLARLLGDLTGL